MKRWYARITEATVVDDRHLDDFHAFFITCFQLKDWLKNDPSVEPPVGHDVEELFDRDEWLGLCADLANSMKHFILREKSVRQEADPNLALVNRDSRPEEDPYVQQYEIIFYDQDRGITLALPIVKGG